MILRKATSSELPVIWNILQQAIAQRKQDGSKQWQNGYPNEQTAHNDFTNGNAYVLLDHDMIIGCCAIIFGIEPTYIDIEGSWLTDGNYATIHRVAILNGVKGKGIATQMFQMIEDICLEHEVYSIKADTNIDNAPMLRIFDKSGYSYCGEILVSSAPRRAYEKLLSKI